MNKLRLFLSALTSQRFRDKHQVKIRYLLTGLLNTLFGLGMFPFLYFALDAKHFHYIVILIMSQSICIVFAYLTNKHMVFKTNGGYMMEFLKFSTFHFIYFLLNLAILPLLVEIIHLTPVIAQAFFSITVIISSYFWHSQITFVSK
jgi:putative flippase GtrA